MDVQPQKQNLNKLFGTEVFYIDFYQRQYKWNDAPVKRLLNDIFYKFNEEYQKFQDSDITLEKQIESYSWYYLNTYVTNTIKGKTYVVDGQQRLTTLTLILIKLVHLAEKHDSKLREWISGKVAGSSGYQKQFWMNHENHTSVLDQLLNGKIDPSEIDISAGITSENLVKNFNTISKYLDKELTDIKRFDSFTFYCLNRLVLINLNVEQTDVPMIFEVINDRGVKLKSYEILKGKLLGQVPKDELSALELNELWDERIQTLNGYYEDEIDDFFTYYLRAKYADTIGDSRKYDKEYHRYIFSKEFAKHLNINHNSKNVKSFLLNEFKYYSTLHEKILKNHTVLNEDFAHVYYNSLTQMDSQFLLIHSACSLNDNHENEKIQLISKEVDRLFTLLQLQRSYDSNEFNRKIYKLSAAIRNLDLNLIRPEFDTILIELLNKAKGSNITEVFTYSLFKETGNELNKKFKRYFFSRIEKFLSSNMNLDMKKTMYDLVQNTGSKNGFHIEHILSNNKENLAIFDNDEELFDRERNRLGALLLLKGRDNQSSNDEVYSEKLKSYSNTLYWNETLREDAYKSKLDFSDLMKNYNLEFRPLHKFEAEEVEERQKLLYNIAKVIWE